MFRKQEPFKHKAFLTPPVDDSIMQREHLKVLSGGGGARDKTCLPCEGCILIQILSVEAKSKRMQLGETPLLSMKKWILQGQLPCSYSTFVT